MKKTLLLIPFIFLSINCTSLDPLDILGYKERQELIDSRPISKSASVRYEEKRAIERKQEKIEQAEIDKRKKQRAIERKKEQEVINSTLPKGDVIEWNISLYALSENLGYGNSIKNYKNKIFPVHTDRFFFIEQVSGKTIIISNIYIDQRWSVHKLRFMAHNIDDVIENTALSNVAEYWRVIGLSSYTTVYGGSTQVLLIEPYSLP